MGIIKLPPRIMPANNHLRNKSLQPALHSKSPIIAPLKELAPIQIITVQDGHEKNLFITFIQLYHYLGYSGPVGQNMKYLVFDKNQNPLAGLLFGSAAWKAGPRDSFIGWDAQQRKTNLHLVTNNSRFLILPWVTVPHLASHLLARVAKRISQDWMHKYGHPILLLETFVERDRFKGTCYKAANWTGVGQTKGRTRNDRKHNISAPVKDIYLFSLSKNFRQELRRE